MESSKEESLAEAWMKATTSAGMTRARLVAEQPGSTRMYGGATIQWQQFLLYFVAERLQEFVDIGPADEPAKRFRTDHLGIAFGWRTIDDLRARARPIPLSLELRNIVERQGELESLFAVDQIESTAAAVEHASEVLYADLLRKLRQRQEDVQRRRLRGEP